MIFTKEITGTAGSEQDTVTVLVANDLYNNWFVQKGGHTVNATPEAIEEGVNIEDLPCFDCFTSTSPINTLAELEAAMQREEEQTQETYTVKFKGVLYPMRTIVIEGVMYNISTTELSNLLMAEENQTTTDEDTEEIDNQIYFYVEPDKIHLPINELKEHVIKEIG